MVQCGRWSVVALAFLLGVVALGACYEPGTPCGDGSCQTGTVCTADREHCVYPEQLTSCAGLADGTACDMRGVDGACRGDICLPIVCGDGFVQPGEEECDGAALGGRTDCLSLDEGYHQAGSLSCTADCRLDRSACGDRCGDGITQAPFEACDVTVGAQTCESAGFHGGTLGCTPDCQLDVSSCDGRCGDGRLTSQEECDGTDFGLTTCNTFGFYGDNLRCTAACEVVEDQCEGKCGDGMKNRPEICDGDQFAGLSCQTYDFYGGTLACGPDCLSVNRSECEGYCGDGVRNGNELCDGLDHEDISCSSFGAIAGALGCNASCQPTFDACFWGTFRPAVRLGSTSFRTVWASSPRDVWASSDSDHLVHFDGTNWSSVDIGLESSVWKFWTSPEGYLWAHTTSGELAYYDGSDWTIAHRGLVGVHVAATTPSNIWVGDFGVARRFDGSTWSEHPMPNPDTWVTQVLPFGDGTVWFATLISMLRFDGTEWTEHDLGGFHFCVWGSGDNDVYTSTDTVGARSITFRYDGNAWTEVEMPFGVDDVDCGWTDDTGAMWIGGAVGHQRVFVLVDDGTQWLIPVNELDVEATWTHSGHLWMYSGTDIMRVDGPPWAARSLPAADEVLAIWPVSAASAWVGTDGHIYRTFSDEPVRSFAVDGTARDVWAAGGDVWFAGTFGVMRYTGVGFEPQDTPPYVSAIWGTSDENIWIAAYRQLLHYDGVAWQARQSFPNLTTGTFIGTDESNLWFRHSSYDFHYEGGEWKESPPLGPGRLEATTGRTDHWLFDIRGNSYQHNGQTTTRIPGTWRNGVRSVWARSPRNVWALAFDQLHHYDGAAWSRVKLPASMSPSALAGSSDTVWLGGAAGALYNLPASLPTPFSGACAPTLPSYCNSSLSGHTAQTVDGPTDCNRVAHPGGELHYKVEVPVTGRLTATATSHFNVDLSVVRADEFGGCDVGSCVGTPISDSKVVLDVQQGQTYYLVVGARGEAAPFTLDVDCIKE